MQRNLKDRLSKLEEANGVVPTDNGDHLLEDLENELTEMEQRLIDELAADRARYFSFLADITEDSRKLAGFVVIVVVLTLSMIALAREGIKLPWFTSQYTVIAFAPSTVRYSLGLCQGIPEPDHSEDAQKEKCGGWELPSRL